MKITPCKCLVEEMIIASVKCSNFTLPDMGKINGFSNHFNKK